ncbi:hypothetical protein D9M68_998310 [compost metagenome]
MDLDLAPEQVGHGAQGWIRLGGDSVAWRQGKQRQAEPPGEQQGGERVMTQNGNHGSGLYRSRPG